MFIFAGEGPNIYWALLWLKVVSVFFDNNCCFFLCFGSWGKEVHLQQGSMWKCPQQSQNVKSNFSLILSPSTSRPIMMKKGRTSASKSWGSFNFLLLSSYFYSLVYFKENMPLFNMKLDAKFNLSILQFKAKGQEQRAGIFLYVRAILVKVSLGSNLRM